MSIDTVLQVALSALNTSQSALRTAASNIARWDGVRWATLGEGVEGSVAAIVVSGKTVYVGGAFNNAGTAGGPSPISVPARNIARWDGIRWSALGMGADGPISAIALSEDELYIGGSCQSVTFIKKHTHLSCRQLDSFDIAST